MRIGLAQIKPVKGDIVANIESHIKLLSQAKELSADAVFFPELSITGYEPELAEELAMTPADQRLAIIQQFSDHSNMVIGLGAPIKTDSGIRISMLIFQPYKAMQIYSKQQLHSDEFPYFENGDKQIIIELGSDRIAPAICFESLQDNHAETAHQLGASIYLASVAKSQSGIDKAMVHYPKIAKKYQIPVLMTNCIGYCDQFLSVGQTAIWSKDGEVVGQLDNQTEGILIFDTENTESRILNY
ncbi:MAG TPA: carbon-nitrogen hydrolase family protein [Saprospiraceae bacterium]|nr:carbon-nitrogen hydrolase family protein [Saprospiraceae bacterium]HPN69902.1 carbon-nitrogen hydrolase family protein [Saprospiraceae bacterium]